MTAAATGSVRTPGQKEVTHDAHAARQILPTAASAGRKTGPQRGGMTMCVSVQLKQPAWLTFVGTAR